MAEGFISDEEMTKLEGSRPHNFISDDEMSKMEAASKPSQFESGLRGAVQGVSMGFGDEITGALESAAGSLGLVPDKTYEQARDESRAAYHAAEEANPATYLASQAGGSLATLAIPGLNVAKGASLGANLGKTAIMGGLTGLGSSEAKDISQMALDTGAGALIGAGTAGGGRLLSGAASTTGNVLKSGANKLVNTLDEIPREKLVSAIKTAGGVALDSTVGSIPGARFLADKVVDKYGNKITEKVFDSPSVQKGVQTLGSNINKIVETAPEALGKYAPVLQKALTRGGASLGATHYVLENSDPEYRKMLKNLQDQE